MTERDPDPDCGYDDVCPEFRARSIPSLLDGLLGRVVRQDRRGINAPDRREQRSHERTYFRK